MKIAICISGKSRFFEEGYSSLEKNILSHNNCDIFMQAYDGPSIENIIKLYKPVKCIIDKPIKDFHITHHAQLNCYPETNIENMFWMFRNIKRSIELVGSNYDLIIRARTDLSYQKPLKLTRLDPHSVYVPKGGDWRGGIFDMFAISTLDNMRFYANCFDMLNKYIESGVKAHPETLLCHHLFQGFLCDYFKVLRFDFNIKLMRSKNGAIITDVANKI